MLIFIVYKCFYLHFLFVHRMEDLQQEYTGTQNLEKTSEAQPSHMGSISFPCSVLLQNTHCQDDKPSLTLPCAPHPLYSEAQPIHTQASKPQPTPKSKNADLISTVPCPLLEDSAQALTPVLDPPCTPQDNIPAYTHQATPYPRPEDGGLVNPSFKSTPYPRFQDGVCVHPYYPASYPNFSSPTYTSIAYPKCFRGGPSNPSCPSTPYPKPETDTTACSSHLASNPAPKDCFPALPNLSSHGSPSVINSAPNFQNEASQDANVQFQAVQPHFSPTKEVIGQCTFYCKVGM